MTVTHTYHYSENARGIGDLLGTSPPLRSGNFSKNFGNGTFTIGFGNLCWKLLCGDGVLFRNEVGDGDHERQQSYDVIRRRAANRRAKVQRLCRRLHRHRRPRCGSELARRLQSGRYSGCGIQWRSKYRDRVAYSRRGHDCGTGQCRQQLRSGGWADPERLLRV